MPPGMMYAGGSPNFNEMGGWGQLMPSPGQGGMMTGGMGMPNQPPWMQSQAPRMAQPWQQAGSGWGYGQQPQAPRPPMQAQPWQQSGSGWGYGQQPNFGGQSSLGALNTGQLPPSIDPFWGPQPQNPGAGWTPAMQQAQMARLPGMLQGMFGGGPMRQPMSTGPGMGQLGGIGFPGGPRPFQPNPGPPSLGHLMSYGNRAPISGIGQYAAL
jgi:hypothetical protein